MIAAAATESNEKPPYCKITDAQKKPGRRSSDVIESFIPRNPLENDRFRLRSQRRQESIRQATTRPTVQISHLNRCSMPCIMCNMSTPDDKQQVPSFPHRILKSLSLDWALPRIRPRRVPAPFHLLKSSRPRRDPRSRSNCGVTRRNGKRGRLQETAACEIPSKTISLPWKIMPGVTAIFWPVTNARQVWSPTNIRKEIAGTS